MNKNKIIAILSVLVGMLAVALILKETKEGSGRTDGGGGTAPVARTYEKKQRLEPEATRRLHEGPVIVSSLFEASGKAEHANWGKAVRGNYVYATTVVAKSQIVSKEEDPATGRVRVVERREFLQARDTISLSEVDAALALDTIPLDKVETWTDKACELVKKTCALASYIDPDAAAGVALAQAAKSAAASAFSALRKIDGASARSLLGAFDVEIPENVEWFVNDRMSKIVQEGVSSVRAAIQSIEGKTFLLTYEQDGDGKPLKVGCANEDGSPISDAEWEILRSANAFLDSGAVPDVQCREGDRWTVWADEMQELFGAACDGTAEGSIHVERTADLPGGDWSLKLGPDEIVFRSADGTASGKLEIKSGNGIVDSKNASVKSLQATARGNLRSLDRKRHFLFFDFVKRIEGDSNLRFTLATVPAAADGAEGTK